MDAPDDRALLRGWIDFARRSRAAHPLYRDGPTATAWLRRTLVDALSRGRLSGRVQALWYRGRLRAVVAAYPEDDSWFGVPRRTVLVHREPRDHHGDPWIVEQVAAAVDARTDVVLLAGDRALIDPILRACPTLGVDLVLLCGDPRTALDRLVEARDPPPLSALGLTAGPVARMGEVATLTEITRAIFTAHPEWGWFAGQPRYLARKMGWLMLNMERDDPDDLSEVLREGGEPVGVARIRVAEHAAWGRLASVGIMLHPRLWGRGVVKSVYRRMLERMVAHGVDAFRGGTSQPSIMHLGRIMGRGLESVYLRAGAPLPRAHFDLYLSDGRAR